MHNFSLTTIEQTLNIYKDPQSQKSSFAMDSYAKNFRADNFVILEKNTKGSRGIPIRCEHYICILALKGASLRHVNQYSYNIIARSLQLLVPGSIYSFEDVEPNSEFVVLLFDQVFLPKEFKELLAFHKKHSQSINLNVIEFRYVLNLYEQLNMEYKNRRSGYKEVAKHLLIQLLYIMKREKLSIPKAEVKNRAQQISNKFLSLVEENFQEYKSVKSYADILNITPKHLSETTKECLGESALHFIHKRVIKEVQYLLCYSDMSIKQISSYLDFENISDFGRFFKHHEGLSPKAYQLQFRK